MAHYNLEKVLYLASREEGFQVKKSEIAKNETTISEIVSKSLKNGRIQLSHSDDTHHYYVLTLKGQLKHLEMKLSYARLHEKDEAQIKHRIEAVKAAMENQQ